MGSTLAQSVVAYDTGGVYQGRGVVTLSNGWYVSIQKVLGSTTCEIRTSTDGDNWTLRGTFSTGAAASRISIAAFPNDNIGVLMVGVGTTPATWLQFAVLTKPALITGAWTLSAWDSQLAPMPSGTYYTWLDMSISDTGTVFVAAMYGSTTAGSNPTASVQVHMRTTGGTTWATILGFAAGGAGHYPGSTCLAITTLGTSQSNRTIMLAMGFADAGNDEGIILNGYRINESTGTVIDSYNYGVYEPDTYPIGTFSVIGRSCALFRSATNEFTLCYTNGTKLGIKRGVLNSGLLTEVTPIQPVFNKTVPAMYVSYQIIASGTDSYSFLTDGYSTYTVWGLASWDASVRDAVGGGWEVYWAPTPVRVHPAPITGSYLFVGGGPADRNLSFARRNFAFGDPDANSGGTSKTYIHAANPWAADSAILTLSPSNLSQGNTAAPNLVATVRHPIPGATAYADSYYKIEFQFARDVGFTTGVLNFVQPDTEYQYIYSPSTSSYATFSSVLTGAALGLGTWYYRARLVNALGQVGSWRTAQSFIVGHPPVSQLVAPSQGRLYTWDGGVRAFLWDFSDAYELDTQTAYQFLLKDSTGTVIVDSGKVVSGNKFHQPAALAVGYKNSIMTWSVRLWDLDDNPGPYATYEAFQLVDAPTVTITTPTNNSILATGIPNIGFTITNTRTVSEYTVTVSKGTDVIWSTGRKFINQAAGTVAYSVQVPNGYLLNNTGYTVQVRITETSGIAAYSNPIGFTTSWTLPTSPSVPTASITAYNVEGAGYIRIDWADLLRSSQFQNWNVYRKADLWDSLTNTVVQTGVWEKIYEQFSIQGAYQYDDYFAPSSHKVTYAVTQVVNSGGQTIESAMSEAVAVYPQSDGYWLIRPNEIGGGATTVKLSIVTGDSYVDEQEQAEFTVIGRGRIVNKGEDLGYKGTLEVQLRHTAGGTPARQKKLQLETAQRELADLWMRNPFGDTFKVNVSAISISRIAGVGVSEFCDAQIPYSEVG